MKILFYNWVDYLDAEKRGGGVSVYQKNLISELGSKDDLDIYFMSSGISYDPAHSTPRVEQVKHGPRENRDRRFEMINSGVLAPGHHSFGFDAQVDHPATTQAFHDFLEQHGPFDVVHFNNLEGIPATAVALKERFPNTRVVFSFHNYYPVCPQVNLWHQETENCLDFEDGGKCQDCLLWQPHPNEVRHANAVAYKLKKQGISPGSALFGKTFDLGVRATSKWLRTSRRWSPESKKVLDFADDTFDPLDRTDNDSPLHRIVDSKTRFSRRREMIAQILNENCDRILCVSDRVAEVAAKFGIDVDLLQTSYIGTKHADLFVKTEPKASIVKPDGTVTFAYMGYMRRDKGYYFLMKALLALPESIARRVRLIVCAKKGETDAMELLVDASGHIRELRHSDGYTHDQIDALLKDVDVGLVPVQWEDNLPQVAIEMHARHIPLLTSDLGGAQELGNSPEMVFEAADVTSFAARISAILEDEIDFSAYWNNAMAPTSMAEHEEELLALYRVLHDPELASGQPDARVTETRDKARVARDDAQAKLARRKVKTRGDDATTGDALPPARWTLPPDAKRRVLARGRKLPPKAENQLIRAPGTLAGPRKPS